MSVINLDNLGVIREKRVIPASAFWEPPRKPLRFSGAGSLEINSKPTTEPTGAVFPISGGRVTGLFGGEINAGWWMGFDDGAHRDFSKPLNAAIRAFRSGASELKRRRNKRGPIVSGDISGGVVTIPSGHWKCRSPIVMRNAYCSLRGMGKTTAIQFEDIVTSGFSYTQACPNSGLSHMELIAGNVADAFSLIHVNSGFMEGSTFEHLMFRGVKRAAIAVTGMTSNHFEVNQCHYIAPTSKESRFILARSLNNRFTVRNTTIGSQAYSKRGIDISGGGQVKIENLHAEGCTEGAVHINDERDKHHHRCTVLIDGCRHNYANGFKPGPKATGPLVYINSERAKVEVNGGNSFNNGSALVDAQRGIEIRGLGSNRDCHFDYKR
jgi:hypothetical protein